MNRALESYLARGYHRINGALRSGETPKDVHYIDNAISVLGENLDGAILYRAMTPSEIGLARQDGYMSCSSEIECTLFSCRDRVVVEVHVGDVDGLYIPDLDPSRHVESEWLLPRGLTYTCTGPATVRVSL